MKILSLPGMQPKTEKWAAGLISELALPDSTAVIQRYSHWEADGEQCMMLESEVQRLQDVEVDLLIGKSLGVVVGLLACRQGLIHPKQAVFIGTPVTSFLEENIDLSGHADQLGIPALYIQQKDDIVGTSGMLCAQVGKAPLATIVEVPGNNHQYKDLKLLARHIKKWLERQ